MKHPFIFKSLTITQNIALIIYTLLILVKCQTTDSHKLMFYFYGIDWFTLIFIVCCIITAASLTAIIFGGKTRIIYLMVKSIFIIATVFFIFFWIYAFVKPEYYKYSSPDHSHEVLIQKESNIFMNDYYVIEYKDSRIVHKTQYHFSAHSNIEKKDCHIKWYDTYAEIKIPNDKNKIEQFDVNFENNSNIR